MSFSIEYQFIRGTISKSSTYYWAIRSKSGRTMYRKVELRSSGTLQIVVPQFPPREGPFQTAIMEMTSDRKRRQISKGGYRTIADAEHGRIVHLITIGRHDYVNPDRITLAEFLLDEWLPARKLDLESSTLRSYEQKLRLHVVPHIGGIALQELSPIDLNNLYTQLLDTTTLPPATSRRHPPETIESTATPRRCSSLNTNFAGGSCC